MTCLRRSGAAPAVTDDALTSCIQELRRALEDDPKQPRFIETRHRRGYRFVAALSDKQSGSVADSTPPTPDASSIAVLPFADMSPGRDQDYLCEGLAEELINTLTHIDGLRSRPGPRLSNSAALAKTFAR
jgi:adenylate cyclase